MQRPDTVDQHRRAAILAELVDLLAKTRSARRCGILATLYAQTHAGSIPDVRVLRAAGVTA